MSPVAGVDLVPVDYKAPLAALLAHGIGLWDVAQTARREGSLDAALRDVEARDLAALPTWVASRLDHLEVVLKDREWLVANRFTAADLIMADVLRVPKVAGFGTPPATATYVRRVTDRPAFRKAHADQLAQFAAADAARN